MKTIIEFLGFKFKITQYEWGRKWFGGTYYYIFPRFLSGIGSFWSDKIITCFGSQIIETRVYK